MESLGFKVLDTPDDMGMARLQIKETTKIIDAVEYLSKQDFTEDASPIVTTHAFLSTNDQYYNNQWGLPKIEAPSAWDITTGSSNVTIGILDSGIPMLNNSLSHPDLQNSTRIILGNDYINEGSGVKDKNGHGSHVAGIASAETNNTTGIAGVSWNTKLFIVKVFDSLGTGSAYTFYMGVRNAVDNGAKVINFSGGGMNTDSYFWSEPLK
jgi:thermitase